MALAEPSGLMHPYITLTVHGFLWHFILTNRLGRYASPEGIRQSLEIMVTYRNLQVSPPEAVAYLAFNTALSSLEKA